MTLSIILSNITLFDISSLDVNFNKSTIGLDSFLTFYMLVKFHDNQKSIIMSSTMNLNFKFLYLKLSIKDGLLNRAVNNIRLSRNLTYVLRT